MSKIVQRIGDLLQIADAGEIEALAHGCNCFCRMGAGFAGKLVRKFPDALAVDMGTKAGDAGKLGTYTATWEYRFPIFNLYTQYNYGLGRNNFDMFAFRTALVGCIKALLNMRIQSLHIPRIGSQLAGGDWDEIFILIRQIMDTEFRDADFTLVIVKWP